jgi:hypothetical protein
MRTPKWVGVSVALGQRRAWCRASEYSQLLRSHRKVISLSRLTRGVARRVHAKCLGTPRRVHYSFGGAGITRIRILEPRKAFAKSNWT